MAIQIRRGTDAQWEAGKSNIVAGEPAVTLDTERLFIGTGNGTFAEFANVNDVPQGTTDTPVMDGEGNSGEASTFARSDHQHPVDTSRASQADLDLQQMKIITIEEAINTLKSAIGTPPAVKRAADMVDHAKIYVYFGNESGWNYEHMYYWYNNAWTDGGAYNGVSVNTDTTLTVSGQAADAKTVGDAMVFFDSEGYLCFKSTFE